MSIPDIRDFAGKRIHLIGIGGSSMSGLAEMLLDQGFQVSGSDRDEGYLIHHVREAGASVMIGHREENVHGADLVVYSAAIAPENPERQEADRLGIPSMERAYLLGQLMRGFPYSVGVCGAHGKTTVTSMLSQILLENGKDPSVHIGGRLDAIGGSTRVGHSGIFVAEACEFNRSFLRLQPTLAVVLNIDADHLDCYRDLDEIEETFGMFLSLLPKTGIAIGNGDDPRVLRQMKRLKVQTVRFGLSEENDWYPGNLTEDERGYASFDLMRRGEKMARVRMGVPGSFNVMNAIAAIATAVTLGVDPERAAESVGRFIGAHRRFELTGVIDGVEIFHDYGHNPAEMRNALSIARKRCPGRLWAVMQPHTFSRVRTLFDQYLTCTEEADFTLVTDICAAREKDPGDLNSGMLVDGMKQHGIDAVWTPSFDDTEQYLRTHWRAGDLVITMGCGDINLLNQQISIHEKEHPRSSVPRNRRIIDSNRIQNNMRLLRSCVAEKTKIMAVVKADGYGHGALATSQAALTGGAEMLAVASVSEGHSLRRQGINAPILVLGVVTRSDAEEGVCEGLIQTVCTPWMVFLCDKYAEKWCLTADIHLKIDTGMGRVGVRTREERDAVLEAVRRSPHVHLSGVFTHFSDADGDEDGIAYTAEQFRLFRELTEDLPDDIIRHCSNSAAIHGLPEMALDMVRAGISLYGYPPVPTNLPLQPCMRWTAKVNYIKVLPAGAYVSYGRTYHTGSPVRVATITCGYADGYHRLAGRQAEVLIRGHRCKIIGRICMDQMMADVTGFDDITEEDEVVLMGSSGSERITAEDIAKWSDTICYEILLSASSRVEHVTIPLGKKEGGSIL